MSVGPEAVLVVPPGMPEDMDFQAVRRAEAEIDAYLESSAILNAGESQVECRITVPLTREEAEVLRARYVGPRRWKDAQVSDDGTVILTRAIPRGEGRPGDSQESEF